MSAAENNEVSSDTFVESDHAPTKFTFGDGGVPIYVGLLWISFIISLIIFSLVYVVPDLASWFGQ